MIKQSITCEDKDATMDVQGRYVQVHDESTMGIRKDDSWNW
jgi:hypothetical protein